MNAELTRSLAAFQQEVPPIFKNTSGYGYKYASLGEIFKVINPLLAKHGLGFTQIVEGNQLTTIVFHSETGEAISGTADIPQGVQLKGMNDFQVMGSALTYLRRYHISSMLCLITDSDIDASGEQSKPSLPSITDARLTKAIKAIESGDYSLQELKATYSLTNTQLKTLE